MSEYLVPPLTFLLVLAGALCGLVLQRRQPESHRSDATRQAVQLVMGLIATMAALVLSLLVASAHTYFTTQQEEVQKLATDVLLLDATLLRYGPETEGLRASLRANVKAAADAATADEGLGSVAVSARRAPGRGLDLLKKALALEPKTSEQRFFQSKALERMTQIATTLFTMHEQSKSAVPFAIIGVMVAWLVLLFLGFGLYAPKNATVFAAFGVGSAAVAGALFLILEMSYPYQGFIHVSDLPIRDSIAVLEQ